MPCKSKEPCKPPPFQQSFIFANSSISSNTEFHWTSCVGELVSGIIAQGGDVDDTWDRNIDDDSVEGLRDAIFESPVCVGIS